MTLKLPKGISQRGKKFRVSIMVDGQRQTATFDTLSEAIEGAENIRAGLVEGPAGTEQWTLEEALQKYIDQHLIPGGYGEKTVEQYTSRIRSLITYLEEDKLLDDITSADVFGYVAAMKRERDLAPSTLKADTVLFGVIMRHARRMKGMHSQVPDMPAIKVKRGHVRFLTPSEEDAILDYFEHIGEDYMADLLKVLIDTGMRVHNECMTLSRDAIDFRQRKVFVAGKSAEPRTVPLTDRALDILRRRTLAAPSGRGPFWDHSYQAVRRRWARVREHLGREDDDRFTLHICRHTFCTRLVSGGVDLKTVQTLAGHKNINTTMRYSHFVPNNMANALAALERKPEAEHGLKVVK